MKHAIAAFLIILAAILALIAARIFFAAATVSSSYGADAKPVIYLYPEDETAVDVTLTYKGTLTCTYPAYDDGWHVTAAPDGTLTDGDGKQYAYLFWEGISETEYDLTEGYCVAGEDVADFLADILPKLGLSAREANEFIVYWLPKMQENAYNLIAFQDEIYTNAAQLDIVPAPDTVIRVLMAWKALDAAVERTEPILPATPARDGFTVIEWGGAEVLS